MPVAAIGMRTGASTHACPAAGAAPPSPPRTSCRVPPGRHRAPASSISCRFGSQIRRALDNRQGSVSREPDPLSKPTPMPFTYSQSTGQLHQDGQLVATGYSGAGHSTVSGRNNSAMQDQPNRGPIPQGLWSIGPDSHHATKGPVVMRLAPIGHTAFGRSGFLIHGDNSVNDASEGCIILNREARERIARSGDTSLTVVP
jgi:hypothetical protein